MSVKEVTFLRKSGKLDEALKMATEELKFNPSDSWAQMSMFWVLRDCCLKIYIPQNDKDELMKILSRMEQLLPTMMDDKGIGAKAYHSLVSLSLPEGKKIGEAGELSKTDPMAAYNQVKLYIEQSDTLSASLSEELGWILFRYLKARCGELSSVDIRCILRDYMKLKNERPSMLHSNILNFAMNFSKGHPDFKFYRFFLMWNPEHLRKEDYHRSEYNGKEIPSFLSRICRTIVDSGEAFNLDELMQHLQLRKKETLLDLFCEPVFWNLYHLYKENKTQELFESLGHYAQLFSAHGPSHWHSEILKLAERCMKDTDAWRFIHFFRAWDYKNLMPEDWDVETDDKGNTYKPLAVKAAKKCFDTVKETNNRNKELLEWLSSLYDLVMEHAKDDEWTERNRAMLYAWSGDDEKALKMYRDLVLKLSEKYYIWSEMAAFVQDSRTKIALLCKALSLEKNENFLGGIRLQLAETLMAEGLNGEALNELNSYCHYREKEGKKLSPTYLQLIGTLGTYKSGVSNNGALYDKMIPKAEEFAFAEMENHPFVLVERWENDGKTRCSFMNEKHLAFIVNAKRFPGLKHAPLGTVYGVKYIMARPLNAVMADQHVVPLCMHRMEEKAWGVFPCRYGYVEHVNAGKRCANILSEQSKRIAYFYPSKQEYCQGTFVVFREYSAVVRGENVIKAAAVQSVSSEEALLHFPSVLAVVDNVNQKKELFHFVSSNPQVQGVIFYDKTTLRPVEGDMLRLAYALSKDKEGKFRTRILKMEATDDTDGQLLRHVCGNISLKFKSGSDVYPSFGFIDDCYIPGYMLRQKGIDTEGLGSAVVVNTGNGKWKVISLEIMASDDNDE